MTGIEGTYGLCNVLCYMGTWRRVRGYLGEYEFATDSGILPLVFPLLI